MSVDIITPSAGLAVEVPAFAHRIVTYRSIRMEWDEYRNGAPALHIVCPRCTKFGLIAYTNKRFECDERGRLSVDEPFRCDYCGSRFGVKDGRMFDA